jgi:hypothetical protein
VAEGGRVPEGRVPEEPLPWTAFGLPVYETERLPPGSPPLIVGANLFGPFEDLHGRLSPAAAMRAAVDKVQRATFEPTGIIVGPTDYGLLQIAETLRRAVEEAKAIADHIGVPYWQAGILGYPPPRKVRWARRRARLRKAIREAPGRLPLVTRYEPSEWGWGPPAGWREPRHGRMWVRVGRWAIGRYDPDWSER